MRNLIARSWLHLMVVIVAVALLITAAVLGWRAQDLRNDPALVNRAFIDEPSGRDVIATVSRGLAHVLSFDWQQPEATRAVADQVLSGQARDEYDTLFASLHERAQGQKLVLTTDVQIAAVQELDATTATLLVFLDQASHREKDDEASVSAAQLLIEAERRGGTWVITGLQPL